MHGGPGQLHIVILPRNFMSKSAEQFFRDIEDGELDPKQGSQQVHSVREVLWSRLSKWSGSFPLETSPFERPDIRQRKVCMIEVIVGDPNAPLSIWKSSRVVRH